MGSEISRRLFVDSARFEEYARRVNQQLIEISRDPAEIALPTLYGLLAPTSHQPLDERRVRVIDDVIGPIRDLLGKVHDTAFKRIVCDRIVSKIKFCESESSRGERPYYDYSADDLLADKKAERLAQYLHVIRGGVMDHLFLGNFMKDFEAYWISLDLWDPYGFRTDPKIKMLAQVRVAARKAAALAMVQRNGRLFRNLSEALQRDRDVVLAAVRQDIDMISFCPLKGDPEVVFESEKSDDLSFYARSPGGFTWPLSEGQKNDQDLVSTAKWREQKNQGIEAAMPFAAALAVVRKNGELLRNLSENMRDNKDVVLAAVRQAAKALPFASLRLQADPEIIKAAQAFDIRKMAAIAMVQQSAMLLEDLSEDLRDDRDVVLQALWQDAEALPFASPRLQADPEIIRAAVIGDVKKGVIERLQEDGLFLQYVVEELKDDEDVVLAAVRQNGEAIPFASPRLQADPEIMKAAQERLHQ